MFQLRQSDDLLVEIVDFAIKLSILRIDRGNLRKYRLSVRGPREINHAIKIVDRDRRLDPQHGVIGSAEDHDVLVSSIRESISPVVWPCLPRFTLGKDQPSVRESPMKAMSELARLYL